MKVLNQLFRQFTQALITSMIICTLVFLPYPANLNNAYAEDSNTTDIAETDGGVECDDGTGGTNGGADVYRVGCEFNEDLAKSKLENHYAEGTAGLIEQFVGAVFALFGVKLFFVPDVSSFAMCPEYSGGGPVSFPIVQAGSLSYLVGEISANAKFKEASKMAVDHAFMEKQNEKNADDEKANKDAKKQNDKQMEAYSTLMKIYEKQVEGLDKKIQMATLAEVAFISATVVEAQNITFASLTCKEMYTTIKTADESYKLLLTGKLQAALGTTTKGYATALKGCLSGCAATTVGAAACASACNAKFTPIIKSCGALNGSLNSYLSALQVQTIQTEVSSEGEVTKKVTATTTDQTALSGFFGSIAALLAQAGWAPAPEGKAVVESKEEDAKAIVNDKAMTIKKAKREAITSTMYGESLCTPIAQTIIGTVKSLEAGRLAPIYCCGIATHTPNLDNTDTKVGATQETPDREATAMLGMVDKRFEEIKNKKYYVKTIIESLLRRMIIDKLYKGNKEDTINQLASSEKYIQYIIDNQDSILHDSNIKKEFETLYKQYTPGSQESQNFLLGYIKKLKQEISISDVSANEFKELLNIGTKVLMLYFVLSSWLDEYALNKSSNRAWTWGIMSVINAAIIKFDKDAKSEAEKRYEITRKEAQKFANSDARSFKIDVGDSGDTSGMKLTKQSRKAIGYTKAGVRACAVPKGSSFAPSMCPSVVTKSKFSFPTNSRVTGGANNPMLPTLGLLSNGAYHAATTGLQGDGSFGAGLLSDLEKSKPALKKYRDKVLAEYDKANEIKDSLGKGNSKKKLSRPKLLPALAKARQSYGSGNKVSTADLNSNSKAILPKLNKLAIKDAKKNKALSKINTGGVNIPTPQTPSFDFDLGDDSDSGSTVSDMGVGTAGEESLTDFQVNSGEINENTGVSIFKLISNRYLRSYPVLLEENKK